MNDTNWTIPWLLSKSFPPIPEFRLRNLCKLSRAATHPFKVLGYIRRSQHTWLSGCAGMRLDQHPPNGLVYAPWFRSEQDVADFLSRGGHSNGAPFQQVGPTGP